MSDTSGVRQPPPSERSLRPWLIIVTGRPAAGKSALADWLGAILSLPVISKDGIKEILFDSLGWQDRAWSKRLGAASVEIIIHLARKLLTLGQSLILDNVFYPAVASPTFQILQREYSVDILQIICFADNATLNARFRQRAESGARHPGHVDMDCLDEFAAYLEQARPLRLDVEGPVIEVDTSNLATLSYTALLAQVQRATGIESTEQSGYRTLDRASARSTARLECREDPPATSPPAGGNGRH